MTKIEELTSLLVNEIDGFKRDVEKLEQIISYLNDTKIKMDVSEYKSIIENHKKEMTSHLNRMEQFEKRFNNKISDAKIYPTWAVVVFIVSLIFSVVSIVYIFLNR